MAIFSALNKYSNFGLLIMRAGLGIMMIAHGLPKLMGGPRMWQDIGESMSNFGVDFYPTAWGLAAAVSEAIGGVLLVIGMAFRPACILLLLTMIVAATVHIKDGDGVMKASHAIELAFVFFGLIFTGPGRFSVDKS